jgi:hypothetical protein
MTKQPDSVLGFITGSNPKVKDEIGNRYGRLVVTDRAPNHKTRAQWHCICDCGGVAIVSGTNLRQGQQRSCGCLRVESAQRFHPRADVDHPRWKGSEASYSAKHQWVQRQKTRTGMCVICGTEGKTDWANVSGQYLRDLNDFAELCKRCHCQFDRSRRVATAAA